VTDGPDKKAAKLPHPARRRRIDPNLLKTVASEILSETDDDNLDELPDLPDPEDELTMLSDGEIPPPPPDEPPPLPEEEFPPPLPDIGMPPLEDVEATATVMVQAPTPAEKDEQAPKKSLFQKRLPIGEILVRHQVINRGQLEYALKYQEENARGTKIGEILMQLELIKEDKYPLLINALLGQLSSDKVDLSEVGQFVDFTLHERFKLAQLEKDQFFPLRIVDRRGVRTLDVFIENDANLFKLDELSAIYSVSKVRPCGTFDKGFLKSLLGEIKRGKAAEITPDQGDRITVLKNMEEDGTDNDAIQRGREDNYISRITDKIIYEGVKLGASDIHVEFGELPRVRYRLDGILQEAGWITPEDYPAVISRLKIMSELDISERRVPQDGNIRLGIEGMGILDFRVNTIPVSGGEKVCLRILDSTKLHSLTLDQIGLPDEILESYLGMISRPQGMILITGPTGSGKSTTLYSSLLYLLDTHGKEMNICTAEDPIEYKLEGLNQTQLNEKVGLTFPKILKALLRQDPDVILVGEIRDLETGELGIKASQTGHLVLSTLHTNTAVATIARMVNMGVEPYLVADSVLAVFNQRLARRVCSRCLTEYKPSSKELALIPANERDQYEFVKGEGCAHCGHKGYKGRIGFYEYLPMNRDLKRLINLKASEEELLLTAREHGFITLRDFALMKVKAQVTTLEEVIRHTIDQFA
jgi:type IV pilus assembly protein PilB